MNMVGKIEICSKFSWQSRAGTRKQSERTDDKQQVCSFVCPPVSWSRFWLSEINGGVKPGRKHNLECLHLGRGGSLHLIEHRVARRTPASLTCVRPNVGLQVVTGCKRFATPIMVTTGGGGRRQRMEELMLNSEKR